MLDKIKIFYDIEDDVLYKTEIHYIDNSSIIKKTPIITKDIFVKCYEQWIKNEGGK